MTEEATKNEPTKQEGEFKIKKKTPKKLVESKEGITKVSLKEPVAEAPSEITKVVVPAEETKAEEVIQIGDIEKEEETKDEVFIPIKEVTEEKIAGVKAEMQEALRDEKVLGKALPENIEKLVSFMEDTGGTIEDYTRLNADYSTIDDVTLLKEYYKKEKPYLEGEDIESILEDFVYDEDMDEARDIRKKKIAFKEEVAKAKSYLEETKSKYYDEIKLRPGVTQEQKKADDFFNRHKEQEVLLKGKRERFKKATSNLLNDNFKGFDFNIGEKKFRYGINNPTKVAEDQSNITDFIGKFLNDKEEISDHKGYHKAMYAASNVDKIATHFYEQGKADAVKEVVDSSKNITTKPRQTASDSVFINGLKVKSITGMDSSKLRIKKKQF